MNQFYALKEVIVLVLKRILFFVIIVMCMVFVGCGSSNKAILATPDKIIIYNKEHHKELDKNNKDFNTIVKLTNQRFKDKIYIVQDIINDNIMSDIRKDGIGLQFIYLKPQRLVIKSDTKLFEYNKLYFQLTSNKNDTPQYDGVNIFQYGDKDHYKNSSRGPLNYSSKLVKLIKKIS